MFLRRDRCPRFLAILSLFMLAASGLLVPAATAGAPRCMGVRATHVGTGKADVLRGTPQGDVFVGRGGGDRLIGRGGDDLFCAGGGDDVVKGGRGNDVLDGGRGNDVLNGGPGTDECTNGETLRGCEGPPDEFEVDGSWAGMTSQQMDISFEVLDHALTTLTINYGWSGPNCTSETEHTVTFVTPLPIVDNAFDYQTEVGHSLQVHGEFSSETQATGTFSASQTGGFCPGSASGTWDAVRV